MKTDMTILRFHAFKESISGTEMIGSMGPNFGQPILGTPPAITDVTLIRSEVDGKMYTREEYDEVYKKYIAGGGEPLSGYTTANLDRILSEIESNN
jgi:hypothetical protein